MIKRILGFVFTLIVVVVNTPWCFATEDLTDISAKSAVVICDKDKSIVFSKNEKEHLPMASTTKIMTAILAMELMNADEPVTITDEMVKVEGSSMGLKQGNILTIENLVKGMMMSSGNDAANAVALAVAGSSEKFACLMNEKAKQIGMLDTNFVTPSGLDDNNHYSTAYDMALLGSYAMENLKFADIVSKKSATVEFIEPNQRYAYANHNRLISMYSGCRGVKTGFTKKSGRCLVSNALRDGLSFTAVTLSAPDDWNDHIKMYDYSFDKIELCNCATAENEYILPVVGGNVAQITVAPQEDESFIINKSDKDRIVKDVYLPAIVYAPVKLGEQVGYIEYKINGETVEKVDIISKDEVARCGTSKSFFDQIFDFFSTLGRGS